MTIKVTEAAAARVVNYLGKRGHGLGLRLGVRKTGCSGYAYTFDYADRVTESDVVFEDREVKLVVDRANLAFLDGAILDFKREGLNEGFRYQNPNEEDQCGCGESVSFQSGGH